MSLEQARIWITEATDTIVAAFIQRQKHMQHIASAKAAEVLDWNSEGISVIRLDREMALLARYAQLAESEWEDPDMVKNLVWHLMYAWKAKQLKILWKNSVFWKENISAEQLKSNLLDLTRDVSRSYKNYWNDYWATKLARKFWRETILNACHSLESRDVAIDLGSADGSIASLLAKSDFGTVRWFDISPDMIEVAKELNQGGSIEYKCVDLFDWIPQDNESVDFLTANFGSASEVHPDILNETNRVLKSGGKAVLSFYNRESITSLWWQPTLNWVEAVLNKDSKVLEVPVFYESGPKVYKIYANPYSESEIRSKCVSLGLDIESIWSFSPAFTLTPWEFYNCPKRVGALESYERSHYHVWPYVGFYISVVIKKP